jgi:ATP-binding cassette subfamily B multidrug efflux pump
VLLLPGITLAQMAQPFVLRQAVDGPIQRGDVTGLMASGAVFLCLIVLFALLQWVQLSWSQQSGARVVYRLRTHLFDHLLALNPSFYQTQPLGKLVTRLSSDVENISEMFSSGGLAIMADVAVILGAIIGMFVMDWRLALYTCLVVPALVVAIEYFRVQSRRSYDLIRVKVAQLNAFLEENLTGMEVVQLFGRQTKNYDDFYALNTSNLKTNIDSVFYDSALSAVVEFLTNAAVLVVLWFGGQAILGGTMTFGLLVAFFQFVQMVFEPVEDISEKITVIQAGLASLDKVAALLAVPSVGQVGEVRSEGLTPAGFDRPSVADETGRDTSCVAREPNPQNAPKTPGTSHVCRPREGRENNKIGGQLAFEGVTFSYRAGLPVLRDVSFTVAPGEQLAIVGPSGSGKSTMIKLLGRFYVPDSGAITLDGVNIAHLDLAELRRHVVVIQQDDMLLSRSVAENIALEASDQVDQARLHHAIATVEAQGIVERLPMGVASVLENRGRNLSSGERQLIQFARAVYHDPKVLVLDEATSAVDPHTESLVQAAMNRVMAGRTVMVIAHRLSTIEQANTVLVLEQGHVKMLLADPAAA